MAFGDCNYLHWFLDQALVYEIYWKKNAIDEEKGKDPC